MAILAVHLRNAYAYVTDLYTWVGAGVLHSLKIGVFSVLLCNVKWGRRLAIYDFFALSNIRAAHNSR